jgi:Uma2 family endonuclease
MDQPTPTTELEAQLDALTRSGTAEARLRRRVLDALLTPDSPPRMSYEEFLEWADEDTYAEWVDGEVVFMSPVSFEHQDIADFLVALLRIFVQHFGLGVVCSAPFQMKTGKDLPGREPDILFVTEAHRARVRPTFLDGPADLAIEIVSPESIGRDRGEKFYEYAQGGVAEYWLIDPTLRWAEFYRLEDGHYRTVVAGAEGRFDSTVLPGFWLKVDWLWEVPRPSVLGVLRELGVTGA